MTVRARIAKRNDEKGKQVEVFDIDTHFGLGPDDELFGLGSAVMADYGPYDTWVEDARNVRGLHKRQPITIVVENTGDSLNRVESFR